MSSCRLKGVPQETITSLSCGRDILSSSWDGSLSLYSSTTLEIKKQTKAYKPVLRTVFSSRILIGDISGNVGIYSEELDELERIGTDVGGVQLLHEHKGRIVVGGWNRRISFVSNKVEDTVETGEKVYCSDISENTLLVGQQEHAVAYDLRTNTPFFRKKLSAVVRSLAITDSGFFAGTTGGRIYYEDFADDTMSYVFNAHYSISKNTKTFYPVNAMKMDANLFSGGSDGKVLRWNTSRRTFKEIMSGNTGISGLCCLDRRLVVAVSYSYDRGECSGHESSISLVDV